MSSPRISIIAAIGKNRELGKNNDLIWRISADLKRVKALTTGHTIVMGRKTYESIGRPLPNRHNIVITRDTGFAAPGCTVVHSLEDALKNAAEDENEIFIFGGAEIYRQALPLTDHLYLTLIEATDPNADTFFPAYETDFTEIKRETGTEANLTYHWLELERAN